MIFILKKIILSQLISIKKILKFFLYWKKFNFYKKLNFGRCLWLSSLFFFLKLKMPQLDLGIFFIEIFFNFLCFWLLYFLLLKSIFPNLNFSLKLRKSKLKSLNLNFVQVKSNLNFFLKLKIIKNTSFLLNIFSLFNIKKIIFSLLLTKKFYFVFFLDKNKEILQSLLKNNLSLNFVLLN